MWNEIFTNLTVCCTRMVSGKCKGDGCRKRVSASCTLMRHLEYSAPLRLPAAATGYLPRCTLAAADLQLHGCCARRFDETALTRMFHSKYLQK